jgi:hypothetical protein
MQTAYLVVLVVACVCVAGLCAALAVRSARSGDQS